MTVALRRCLLPSLVVIPLGCSLAACSGDTVRTLATQSGYGPPKVEAPDFVTSSRPKEAPGYMPVGVDAPRRPNRPRTEDGQKALETELEQARGRNTARGHAAESAAKGVAKGLATGAAPAATPSPN